MRVSRKRRCVVFPACSATHRVMCGLTTKALSKDSFWDQTYTQIMVLKFCKLGLWVFEEFSMEIVGEFAYRWKHTKFNRDSIVTNWKGIVFSL